MAIAAINSLSNATGLIQKVQNADGSIDSTQVNKLVDLFSQSFYNAGSGTAEQLDEQIEALKALLDNYTAQIEALYNYQRNQEGELNNAVNALDQNIYQATKKSEDHVAEQKDLVSKATDTVFRRYMKGEIEKDEIPNLIADELSKTSGVDSSALKALLNDIDGQGDEIKSMCNDIANILDSINKIQINFNTTKTSYNLLKQLRDLIPDQNERADIKNVAGEMPVYTPTQTQMMAEYAKVLRPAAAGDGKTMGTPAQSLAKDLGATVDLMAGTYTTKAIHSTADLDALKNAGGTALEDALNAENGEYSIMEKLYLMDMDYIQAGNALSYLYATAGVGFSVGTGMPTINAGHDGLYTAMRVDFVDQYKALWGQEITEETGDTAEVQLKDPIGYNVGNTSYDFIVDRNEDGIFNDASEFLGAETGWEEMVAYDKNGDGELKDDELDSLMLISTDQNLTGGGGYSFMSATMAGIESIDLSSYSTENADRDINGNTVVGTFGLTVAGANLNGRQTEASIDFLDKFYSHTYEQELSFSLLDDNVDVSKLIKESLQVDETDANTAKAGLNLTGANTDSKIDSAESEITANEEEAKMVENGATDISDLPEIYQKIKKHKDKKEELAQS